MIPGINPRDMQKAMKRLGIKQDEICANEVIIKCSDNDIVIKNPHVAKIEMLGNTTFQISGEITIAPKSNETEIGEEDIQTVISQTNCAREDAIKVLKQVNGNIAEAILKIKN